MKRPDYTDKEPCPCGLPLHYSDPELKRLVEGLIEDWGKTVAITTPAGTWEVPRHYVALHGIVAKDLPKLAEKYGFCQISPKNKPKGEQKNDCEK